MFDGLLEVIGKALLSLTTLFLVTKIIGKKQVSELSVFDYVIGISIGNFSADITMDTNANIFHGTVAVVLFGLIAYLISIGTMKSIRLRRFFTGTPTIIIEDGKLLEKGLKQVKFDINDFLEQCREQGYFDISKISYAVMETNGKISILPKAENSPVTIKDMKMKTEKASIEANVIIDGNIMPKNLEYMNKTKEWLIKKLKNRKIENILLATLDNNGNVKIYEKNNKDPIRVLE